MLIGSVFLRASRVVLRDVDGSEVEIPPVRKYKKENKIYSWKLPRYITYDLRWRMKHYKVTVRHARKARYIGNYPTLNEAIRARDEYCHVHDIQFVEKDGWDNLSGGGE